MATDDDEMFLRVGGVLLIACSGSGLYPERLLLFCLMLSAQCFSSPCFWLFHRLRALMQSGVIAIYLLYVVLAVIVLLTFIL